MEPREDTINVPLHWLQPEAQELAKVLGWLELRLPRLSEEDRAFASRVRSTLHNIISMTKEIANLKADVRVFQSQRDKLQEQLKLKEDHKEDFEAERRELQKAFDLKLAEVQKARDMALARAQRAEAENYDLRQKIGV